MRASSLASPTPSQDLPPPSLSLAAGLPAPLAGPTSSLDGGCGLCYRCFPFSRVTAAASLATVATASPTAVSSPRPRSPAGLPENRERKREEGKREGDDMAS